jgi:colanic acid biosynthesis glycosyl transferase WcaI
MADTKDRILVICQHFWPESFRINDMCDYFVESGLDVEVVCGLPNYPKGELYPGYSWRGPYRQEHNGIKIRRSPEIPRKDNSNLFVFLNYVSFPFLSLLQLPRLMFGKYDRIFMYQLSPVMMSITGILLGKIRRIPTSMYVLDLWPENMFSVLDVKNRFLRNVAKWVSHWHYRNVDKIIVLSHLMKQRLLEITGLPEDRIAVLPQACEKIYEQDVHNADLAERFRDGFKIVFTGNISAAQSFETILEAAGKLKADGYDDLKWIIVGDGMTRKEVEADVEKLGLADSFYFEGHRPVAEVPGYTGIADALVGCLVKSDLLEATIPAKVLSYIASGRPLVLAMDGEVRDLVADEAQCGLVGPAGDTEALVANIKKLHSMAPEQRAEMGRRGREYHFKHLERNIVLGKLTSFIFDK